MAILKAQKTMLINVGKDWKMFDLNRFFKTIILLVALLSLCSQAASLSARVDRDTISIDDTVMLIVKTDGQGNQSPDFSALKTDFDILGNSQSRNIQVVNGHAESAMEWQLTLAPKRIGKLLIPSFNLGNDVSDAITIQVNDASSTQSTNSLPIHVSIELDKDKVYTQEQILLTVKLVTEVSLAQAELQALELPNAIVSKLDEQQYQTEHNGKPQLVLETRYAIFPQASGELSIPPLVYSVVPQTNRDIWNDPFGRRRASVMRLRTQQKTISITPALDSTQAPEWHPAESFSLNEGWIGDVSEAKVGEPITRTITMMADGLTAGQIQPLTLPKIDGLTFYPDQPQTKDNKSTKGVQGIRTESFAIIPNKAGDITLPAVKVHWWDTKNKTIKIAELPEKVLHVTGGTSPQAQAASIQNQDTSLSNTETASEKNNLASAQSTTSTTSIYLLAAGLFLSLGVNVILLTLLLKSRLQQTKQTHVNPQHPTGLVDENMLWDQLKQAEKRHDLQAMKKAVIAWAKYSWSQRPINTLDDVIKCSNQSQLASELRKLDSALYSGKSADVAAVDLHTLLAAVNDVRKTLKNEGKTESSLPPLYKS